MTNPDGMTTQELAQAGPGGGTQYAYLDQTRTLHVPLGGQGDGVSSPELNPAYYPKAVKPEAFHGEAEKAGEEFPTGGTDTPAQAAPPDTNQQRQGQRQDPKPHREVPRG